MEQNEIKYLLEKYYEGQSSAEDENKLMQYFKNNEVSAELKADQELFLFTYSEKAKDPSCKGLEQKLTDLIDKESGKERKKPTLFLLYKISSIAAAIAIMVAIYLAIQTKPVENKLVDTYNDPKLAYEQVKRTLMYISQNINQGTEKLNNVSKMNQGFNELSVFSSFNSGLENLELVSKYYEPTKIEKQ